MGLIVLMMTGTLVGLNGTSGQGGSSPITQSSPLMDYPQPETASDSFVKVTQTPVKGTAKMIVATNDVAALARGLKDIPYQGALGENAEPGLAFPILTLPVDSISAVEAIDGVLGVYPFQEAAVEGAPSGAIVDSAESEPQVEAAYTGAGTSVAVVDTGIDFAHSALAGKYQTVPATGTSDKEQVLVFTNVSIEQAFLNYGNVHSGTLKMYVNDVLLNATDYTVNLATGQLDFDPALASSSKITASYDYDSPYAGWPMAYDPASMKSYVDSAGDATGGYINSTYNGTGPFEIRHTLTLDGTPDFSGSELLDNDKNNYIDQNDPTYDVRDLNMARDKDAIYAGFTTFTGNPQNNQNMSYAIYFDMDGSVSGADSDPRGNYINTASSHANWVNFVGMSPDGSKVASVGGGKPYKQGQTGQYRERLARIWTPDGILLSSLTAKDMLAPMWAAWAPDSKTLVTADLGNFYVWDTDTGKMLLTTNYNAPGAQHPPALTENAHAIVDVSPDGTLIAIAGMGSASSGIGIYDMNGNWLRDITLTVAANAHSVAFSPDGTKIAAALSNGTVEVFDTATGAFEMVVDVDGPAVEMSVYSVRWNPAGTMIAAGTLNRTLSVINYPSGSIAYTWYLNYAVNDIAWSGSSKIAIATSYTIADHNRVLVFDVTTPSQTPLVSILHDGGVTAIDWVGNTIYSASKDTRIRIIDASSATPSEWNISGIFYSRKVDYALYFDHRGVEWGLDEEGEVWTHNDTFPIADLYKWTGTEWQLITGATNTTVGITKANSVLLLNNTLIFGGNYYEIFEENNTIMYNGDPVKLIIDKVQIGYNNWATWPSAEGYVEAKIPRYLLEDPVTMDVMLFSVSDVPTRPQDTVPSDPNVELSVFDNSTAPLSLSAFATYTPPMASVNTSVFTSQSGKFHIGFHPDKNILKTGIVSILVMDPNQAGIYDTIVMDGNMDRVFDQNDPVLNLSNPVESFGYYDQFGVLTTYSSGTLYYIADGTNPIPYLRTYMARYSGFDQNFTRDFVPKPGEVICLSGEFGVDSVHGTKATSVISAAAPDVKFVPVGDMTDGSFFDALYFTAEGYDGAMGSADDVASAYIGVKYELDPEVGWDVYSKFADWISAVYTNGTLALVTGAGDRGFGYGTVSSPGAAKSVITVGFSQDYRTDTSSSAGPSPKWGDVSSTSARGPTFAGIQKPDILDLGQVQAAVPYPSGLLMPWESSDAAAARTVGALALLGEAYSASHSGAKASVAMLREFLMSGADDLGLDANVQGAGLVNVAKALALANSTNGISVSPNSWTPGDWNGNKWASAPAVLSPGASDNQTFALSNRGSTAQNLAVEAGRYKKIGEFSMGTVPIESDGSVWSILINETGMYQPDDNWGLVRVSSMSQTIWNMASSVQVRATAPWNQVYLDDSGYVYLSHKFMLTVYDLTAYTQTPFPGSSMNAFARMANTNSLQVEVSDPARRTAESYGIVVEMKHMQVPFEMGEIVDWTIDLEFYTWDTWNWIDAPASVSLTSGGTGQFTAGVTVPEDTGAGTYEGSLSLRGAPVSVTGEMVSEYPLYTVSSKQLGNYSFNNYTGAEILGNPVGGETTATITTADPIIPGSVDLWLERYWTNATWIYNTTGTEVYDADWNINITLPHPYATNLDWRVFYWDGDFDGTPDDLGFWDDPVSWGDPYWPVLDPATGNVTLGLGGYVGAEVWVSYQYPTIPLVLGVDYTINLNTGVITLLNPTKTITNETVVNSQTQINADISSRFFLDQRQITGCTLYMRDLATDSWTKLVSGTDYELNTTWGFFDLLGGPLGTDMAIYAYYNASTIARGYKIVGDYSTFGSSFNDLALDHPYFSSAVMYVNGAPVSSSLYSITDGRGDITFNPPLVSGSIVNVSYKWYDPQVTKSLLLDHSDVVPGTLQLFIADYPSGTPALVPTGDYILNERSGAIMLDGIQEPGTIYTASYQYYSWISSVPVSITVMAEMKTVMGGTSAITVTDNAIDNIPLTRVDDEFLLDTNPVLVVNETIAISTNNIIQDEFVASNPVSSVAGEILFTALGNEGVGNFTWFDHNYDTGQSIVNPSVTIYEDGVPLTENVDYSLTYGSVSDGYNAGKLVFLKAPVAGALYTADYSYYYYKLSVFYLDHGDPSEGIWEEIVSGTVTLFLDGTPTAAYSRENNVITLGAYLQPGSVITGSYTYCNRIMRASLAYGTQMNPGTAILPGSCTVYNNGVAMLRTNSTTTGTYVLYDSLDKPDTTPVNGLILLNPPLGTGTVLKATYKYYPIVNSTQLFRGTSEIEAIADGTVRLFNNGEEIGSDEYSVNYDTGAISFGATLAPSSVINATYAYFNPNLAYRDELATGDQPYGVNLIRLNNNNVIANTVVIKINGVELPATEYTVDEEEGIVHLLSRTIAAGETITASYDYIDMGTYSLMPGSMIGGGEYGDWRFFYLYMPDQGVNKNFDSLVKFMLDASWEDAPADIDFRVFMSATQTNPAYMDAAYPDSRYSSFTMTTAVASKKKGEGVFFSETGIEREYLVANLVPGMILVAANNALSSAKTYVPLTVKCGNIYMTEPGITEYTHQLSGSASFSMVSSMPWDEGAGASVLGPAVSQYYPDQDVYTNDPDWYAYKDWPTQLAYGQLADEPLYLKAIEVKNAATLEVHVVGHDNVPDVDIGVYLDGKNGQPLDGEIQAEEWMEESYQGGTAGADEKILIVSPPDGTYLIRVFGFTLTQVPGQFDLTISMIVAGGGGYGLSGSNEDELPDDTSAYESSVPIDPFEVQTFTVSWNFPESSDDSSYGGVLYIGPKSAPKAMTVLITIVLDRTPPVITSSVPGDSSVISDTTPTISASCEDAFLDKIKVATLDPTSPRIVLDDVDVTFLCAISVPKVTSSSALVTGYVTGTITYVPIGRLSEGGHVVEISFGDQAGNIISKKWGFTIDSVSPGISLNGDSGVTYTNTNSVSFSGAVEPGSNLKVRGVSADLRLRDDGTFTADVTVSDGESQLAFVSTDAAGNEVEVTRTVIVDKVNPTFKRLVALDGSTTNQRTTGVYGEMSEPGTLLFNGNIVPVNSDGTFRYEAIPLIEGRNQQVLEFTDLAGNVAYDYLNITLDTAAPMLAVDDVDSVVDSEWLNITGTTEGDAASLTVNGKLVDVSGDGSFTNSIRLSPGSNTIVIESKDRAGNSAQEILTVTLDTETAGTNWAAIGLMVVLLVVGLVLGLFVGPMLFGKAPAEEAAAEPEAGAEEPAPEAEEAVPEAGAEEVPAEETVVEEELPAEPAEPIPAEEAAPEAEPQTEAKAEEELPAAEPAPAEEDPRIAKLRDAYESGKISKELYEKNLAKFKGNQ